MGAVASLSRTKTRYHRIRAHTVVEGRNLTNASVLLCSCRLVSASLRVAACCSATICAWALDAAAAAVFNASWLTASSPSSRRHSAWLCRRCSPVCGKGFLKQGSVKLRLCVFVVFNFCMFVGCFGDQVNVNFFSQLGRNPCMSNYLSQGRGQSSQSSAFVCLHLFLLHMERLCWVFSTIRIGSHVTRRPKMSFV